MRELRLTRVCLTERDIERLTDDRALRKLQDRIARRWKFFQGCAWFPALSREMFWWDKKKRRRHGPGDPLMGIPEKLLTIRICFGDAECILDLDLETCLLGQIGIGRSFSVPRAEQISDELLRLAGMVKKRLSEH